MADEEPPKGLTGKLARAGFAATAGVLAVAVGLSDAPALAMAEPHAAHAISAGKPAAVSAAVDVVPVKATVVLTATLLTVCRNLIGPGSAVVGASLTR
ncbi:hypothetical protein HC028_26715 [Planosporangium flavigriseum]|uniref:Uncharacterized protein n=1 Tax=Planosporangium flavigriseum TaxID=373681 RepID=A0A8J3LU74_9ACTN|nr:hypothetical protein [Planosporangium flavigriseum]NJC68067.1 hypothetical protein [Planosporangium flavigriseum]GIG76850.1 hypothetical protein Pfl04_52540 [Planosporangium flavigriseum]